MAPLFNVSLGSTVRQEANQPPMSQQMCCVHSSEQIAKWAGWLDAASRTRLVHTSIHPHACRACVLHSLSRWLPSILDTTDAAMTIALLSSSLHGQTFYKPASTMRSPRPSEYVGTVMSSTSCVIVGRGALWCQRCFCLFVVPATAFTRSSKWRSSQLSKPFDSVQCTHEPKRVALPSMIPYFLQPSCEEHALHSRFIKSWESSQ